MARCSAAAFRNGLQQQGSVAVFSIAL